MNEKLRVFKWRKIGCILFLPMLVIMVIAFLAFGYIIGLSYIKDTYVTALLFFLTLYGINYFLNALFSKFIYPETGWIGLVDDKLIVLVNNEKETYSKNDINTIKFLYKGDNEWQSKIKSMTRYHRKRSDHIIADERFDKIIINDTPFYVKIQNESEKNLFYQIVGWAEKNNIEFYLI